MKLLRTYSAVAVMLTALAIHGLTAQTGGSRAPKIDTIPSSVSGTHYASQRLVISTDIQVSGQNTDYALGFTAGGSLSYQQRRLVGPNGATLNYQLYTAVGDTILKDYQGGDGTGLLTGYIQGNNIAVRTMRMVIPELPAGQSIPLGTYSDQIRVRLYRTGTTVIEERTLQFWIEVVAPPYVSVQLIDPLFGASDKVHLDFGNFERGAKMQVQMLVNTNIGYEVSIQSTHSGAMRLVGGSDGSIVPYLLRINGTERSLAAGRTTIGSSVTASAAGGDLYGLQFEVGEIEDATSGYYEDWLTVIVEAR